MKPAKLTQRDIDDFNALPAKEKIKAWESMKHLEQLGELEPIDGLIVKPMDDLIEFEIETVRGKTGSGFRVTEKKTWK